MKLTDLANKVQRHSKCSFWYCLRQDHLGNQYCTFHYPFEMNDRTYIKYNNPTSKRPEIAAKRNGPRVNRYQ